MVKIRRKVLLVLLFGIILLVAACAKAECKTSADCAPRTCFISKCQDRKCGYTLQRNCCGNKLQESIENGKAGNQCTCPDDYGKCEGKAKIKIGSREQEAAYVHYFCSADSQCILGVEKSQILPQNFPDIINVGFFKASAVAKYNKPFDVAKDYFEVKITLDDASKDMVFPVTLTKIKLLYSGESARAELLVAEKEMNNVLNAIGDSAVISIPLNLNYRPQELEEQGSVRYSLDYAYTRQMSNKAANGTTIYNNEVTRGTFNSPTKPIFFFRSG